MGEHSNFNIMTQKTASQIGYSKVFLLVVTLMMAIFITNLASAALYTKLLAYYDPSATSGTAMNNQVSGLYNGTLMNNVTLNSTSFGNVLLFPQATGKANYVNVSMNAYSIRDQFTYNVWVNTSINDNTQSLVLLNSRNNFLLFRPAINIVSGLDHTPTDWLWDSYANGGSGGRLLLNTGIPYVNNAWTMFTLVKNSTTSWGYINGVLLNQTANNTVGITFDGNLTIGGRADFAENNLYNTSLSKIGIWNRPLSTSEIATLYNSGAGLNNSNVSLTTTPTYSNTTYETSNEQFLLNFTANNIVSASAVLVYNGTNYPSSINCANTLCIASNNLDIPLLPATVPQNRTFYWSLSIYDGSNVDVVNTTTYQETVNNISLVQCTSGNVSLNFTSFDEQNRTRISPYSFDGTFNYYVGSGSVYRQLNITNSSAIEVDVCLNPVINMKVDSIIAYTSPTLGSLSTVTTSNTSGNSTQSSSSTTTTQTSTINYPYRNWFYQNHTINGVMQSVKLYLLKATSSTQFVLQVQGRTVQAVPNVLVVPQRCYSGQSTVEPSFISRTDSSGLTSGNFEAVTALYQFNITSSDNSIFALTSCSQVVPQTVPYTLLFQIGNNYTSAFVNLQNVNNLNYSLTYNSTNSQALFVYTDNSNAFSQAQLIVTTINASGNYQPVVCANTNNLSSGIISCNMQNNGSYFATAYITRTTGQYFDRIIFMVNHDTSSGYYGIFLGWFLILVGAFMFKFNEIAGIWVVNAMIFFCNYLQLINFGSVFVTSSIFVGLILTAVLRQ